MKNICVYSSRADVNTDSPQFHTSKSDAEARIQNGSCFRINATAIMFYVEHSDHSREHMIASGRFDTAWKVRQSGPNGPLVYQLQTNG